jgi:hypothetical protein
MMRRLELRAVSNGGERGESFRLTSAAKETIALAADWKRS